MRKQSFVVFVGFFSLAGCSSATFSVVSNSADASLNDDVRAQDSDAEGLDGGIDGRDADVQKVPDAPLVCEPFSCRSGCNECDAGLGCGNGGASTCGSKNCTFDLSADASSFNCPSGMAMIFKCNHYTGQNSQDIMPRCLFRSGTTADNDVTRWCCPQ